MAASFTIHVLEGATEADFIAFRDRDFASYEAAVYTKIAETPSLPIGDVSWLKAALCEDTARYVPNPIAVIAALLGDGLTLLDEPLLLAITDALTLSNTTSYSLTPPEEVLTFLQSHLGSQVFQISW